MLGQWQSMLVLYEIEKRLNLPKGDIAWLDYKEIVKKPNFFVHVKTTELKLDDEVLNPFFFQVFKYGNATVIIDELARIATPTVCDEHDRIIRQGRARGIGIWHLIQRPVFVDNYVFTEAEHTFVFLLKTESDRKKIAGMIDVTKDDMRENLKKPYHFYYDNTNKGCNFCNPI